MSLPFAFPTAGRPPRADGPPVVASSPPGAATGDLIARLRAADWSDGPEDDFFPDRSGRTGDGPNLALLIGFVVLAAIASVLLGVGLGYLAAKL